MEKEFFKCLKEKSRKSFVVETANVNRKQVMIDHTWCRATIVTALAGSGRNQKDHGQERKRTGDWSFP